VYDIGKIPEGFLRDDVQVGDYHHFIFSTDLQLDLLKRARNWYIDSKVSHLLCFSILLHLVVTFHDSNNFKHYIDQSLSTNNFDTKC
jgi:hypothetical protein